MGKVIRRVSALSVLALAGTCFALSPWQASAASHSPSCSLSASDIPNPDMSFGTNVPVILVHGVNGSPADWEARNGSSICDNINGVYGASVALNFKYGAGPDWGVPADTLVPLINEIADQSARNGGPGKVVIVAYSLGTAITRTTFTGGRVNNSVGQVISIAAPNTNPWENYPSDVIVRAIRGDILNKVTNQPFIGTSTYDTYSDGLVPEFMAFQRYTNNPIDGGGRVKAVCFKTYRWDWGWEKSTPFNELCNHGNLLKNPTVRSGVITGIEAYIITY